MRLFAEPPIIDPRAPYEALNDLIALFKVEPLLKRLTFDTHWRGWHDEHPPANPRMIFWVSAWVGNHEVQSPQGLAMAQAVERVLIDRGLMIEPEEGYNWNGRNTLQSTWKRKDVVKAFEKEAQTPLADPGRLALLRSQALLEYLNPSHITHENLDHRQTEITRILNELVSGPAVPVDPPNVPSKEVLHLRRQLHALRGDPVLERLQPASRDPGRHAVPSEVQALHDEATAQRPTGRRPGR